MESRARLVNGASLSTEVSSIERIRFMHELEDEWDAPRESTRPPYTFMIQRNAGKWKYLTIHGRDASQVEFACVRQVL